MAYALTMNSGHSLHVLSSIPGQRPRHASKQRFVADLSQCLFDFVIQLLPTAEEMAVKEDVRKLLERLIRTIEPDSRLLSFGSTANGFSLRNSDMDLCCLIDSDERLAATDLVTMLGDLLERETKFHVKPLPHARIPIVKLSLDPSPGLPLGIACDIGFENRLALENTRLLMCYAMVDPTRVRTMVLFLKVWSKRRKINSPYKGTLSSYGYVLLVIYFLVHVKNPPVLPNLQQMPPLRPITQEDTHLAGYNTWFFDDIDLLRQRWHSDNTESVAELLIDFFRYYSRDFSYNTGVASIRAGLLKKDSKGWQNDLSTSRYNDARERNRFCIEDPFEMDFNVARCVTKDGLYTIRGEFMRAARILATRPERAIVALAELCEERKEEDLVSAPLYVPPRLSSLPSQTPYTVGGQSMRPKGSPPPERLSSSTQFSEPGPLAAAVVIQQVSARTPPEHMAPKRGKWTSPPPPEAPSVDHTMFENQLGKGLELATAATEARENEASYNSSSSNSEILTDEEPPSDVPESDDARSVQSFTDGSSCSPCGPFRRPLWLHTQDSSVQISPQSALDGYSRRSPSGRGRRVADFISSEAPTSAYSRQLDDHIASTSRRSLSGPVRSLKVLSWSSNTPTPLTTPLPPSPDPSSESPDSASTVFYQTTTTRSPRPTVLYPTSGSHSPLLSQYQHQQYQSISAGSNVQHDLFPSNHPPSLIASSRINLAEGIDGRSSGGPDTPTPTSYAQPSHSHSYSTTTVTAPTPPPHISKFSQPTIHNSPLTSTTRTEFQARSQSRSPPTSPNILSKNFVALSNKSTSPPASTSNGSASPTPSSTGYATSLSRSPSPSSPPPVSTSFNQKVDISTNPTSYLPTAFDGLTLMPTMHVETADNGEKHIVKPIQYTL